MTAKIKEKNETVESNILDDYKAIGKKRVLYVAKVDRVFEIRYNIEIILDSLNLTNLSNDFFLVCVTHQCKCWHQWLCPTVFLFAHLSVSPMIVCVSTCK